MILGTWQDAERHIANRVPESSLLEYKRDLDLGTPRRDAKRREILKDLTGMGNGGGGTIAFGIAESSNADALPDEITPLTDRGVVGQLENIVRSGVRPPLLVNLRTIDDPDSGGFVLVAHVHRSPLGPYSVEAYGEPGYYVRRGRSTVPMGETEVRDAYALAIRAAAHRQTVWDNHGLPFEPDQGRWLGTYALPREPLSDLLDLGSITPQQLTVAQLVGPSHPHVDLAQLRTLAEQLQLWADGFFAESRMPPAGLLDAQLRIHRDGAAAAGVLLVANQPLTWPTRRLNGQLLYLSALWRRFELREPVELQIHIWNAVRTLEPKLPGQESSDHKSRLPAGAPDASKLLHRDVLVDDLASTHRRHQLVRDFADRLHQAFGQARASELFSRGWLHRPNERLKLALNGPILVNEHDRRVAYIDREGGIQPDHAVGADVVAFVDDGCIVDLSGNALAAVELSGSAYLPDAFPLSDTPEDPPTSSGAFHVEPLTTFNRPEPTGEWSSLSFEQLLRA